jgi:hypothetical protein
VSGSDWRTLAGFGAVLIAVNYFDRKAALVLVGLVAAVAVFKHPGPLTTLFGGANASG